MALYISSGRRRRRVALVAVLVGVMALGLGIAIGRQQLPSIDDRVAQVTADAADISTGLQRLEIEYEQVRDGTDTLEQSVLTPFAELLDRTQQTMDEAPWITSVERSALLDALVSARQSAIDDDSVEIFRIRVDDAATLVRSTFRVDD